MQLKVLIPSRVLLDKTVTKVTAEAADGHFTLLPRHVDFVAALVPGILTFHTEDGAEHYLALDGGVLVKQGFEIYVSAMRAIRGNDIAQLREFVENELQNLKDAELQARSVAAKLESDTLLRFMQLGSERHK